MRACLLAIAAAFVCAATGCANFSHGKRGDCNAAIPCSEPVACAKPVGCAAPIGCAAAVSPYAPAAAVSPAMPAGVAPYAPAGVAPYAPPMAPYDPGYARFPMHRGPAYGGPAGPPTAQVAYPYYTTRGPRDFLLDNPPSIGR
jgi:hypothetical protein